MTNPWIYTICGFVYIMVTLAYLFGDMNDDAPFTKLMKIITYPGYLAFVFTFMLIGWIQFFFTGKNPNHF